MSPHTQNRLMPLSLDEWPSELADLSETFFAKAHVYRVMAHHPALVRAWTNLRQHIVIDTSLSRETSEIVILRASVNLNAIYEWSHHVLRARKLGLTDNRIASIRGERSAMISDDAILSRAVDELVKDARLSPDTLADLSSLVGSQGVLDVMATVGFYSTLAFILNSFDTDLEPDIQAELQANPLSD